MSVWLTIPSKRPPEEAEPVLKQWRERGYKIALWKDGPGPEFEDADGCNLLIQHPIYPGYAVAANRLIAMVAERHPDAEYFVCGGDDVLPDPNHTAAEIAEQCRWYFTERHMCRCDSVPDDDPPSWIALSRSMTGEQMETFGVMQPIGDRWGIDPNTHTFVSKTAGCGACACQVCGRGEIAPVHLTGAYIDRVAGSPWIGREFARRMYQGKGPYWPEYTHMGVDEELQAVAMKLGIFWQRPDLTHFHQHWGRPRPGEFMGQSSRMPEFLAKANSAEEWARFKRIITERQRAGFPGSEPVA